MSDTSSKDHLEPIAVIGIACRFPGGANTPSKLWDLLKEPRDLSEPVPTSRFHASAYFHPDGSHHGAMDCQRAYFIQEDISLFDNSFFSISSGEADAMDPQQRVLMETVFDSLSSAGQRIEDLRGSNAAVYVGLMCDDWAQLNSRDWDLVPTYGATGTSRSIFSNRISYFFDWHGPSVTIDTACSSSLVAVHQAISSLRNGESPIAIAAGTNLILSPGMWIAESKLHMLSPTGSSKMWSADADGYARGEGVAAIVMKPLSAALRDGDPIECVIRATGVNQDGRTPGLTMPSNLAQSALIRDTYARAGLNIEDPRDHPQFFHAHGTGTPAGDPQEAEAISRAFSASRSPSNPLYVGSIKTVIGHSEGTAGLASLIGTVLAMKNGTVPPNLHFDSLSPSVAPFYTNLRIPTKAEPWPRPAAGQPLRASINSFGFGGTNAHAIIESYTPAEAAKAESTAATVPSFAPLTFSAASPTALRHLLVDTQSYLIENIDADIRDVAFSLYQRRSALSYRKVVVAEGTSDAVGNIEELLSAGGDDGLSTRYSDSVNPTVLGVFTGQGAQWARMGARLIESSPFVSARLAELDASLAALLAEDRPQWTLREQLLAHKGASRLSEAAIAQPLCTAVQIVLVDLTRAAGVQLKAVVGHSSGEIGCAYAAGFLSADDALRVAYFRGLHAKLAHSPNAGETRGAMMAVATSYEDAVEFCSLDEFDGRIQVAARNSPTSMTLSGDESAVEEALAIFSDEGKFARRLLVDTAYHSRHMLPCSAAYLASLHKSQISVKEGNGTTWFSSVDEGRIITRAHLQDSTYWIENMTQAVLFGSAAATAVREAGPFDLAVEFGPHPALKTPCLDSLVAETGKTIAYTGLLSRGKDDVKELSAAFGFVWANLGSKYVDLAGLEKTMSASQSSPRFVRGLPAYRFDHSRSFLRLSRFSGSATASAEPPNPILGRRCVETETSREVSWRNILRQSEVSWLKGHALQGQTVFAGMGYVSMGVEAVASVAGLDRQLGLITLSDVEIGRAMAFSDEQTGVETKVTLRIDLLSETELRGELACYSGPPLNNTATPLDLNYRATVTAEFGESRPDTLPSLRRDEVNLSHTDIDRLYTQFTKLGYNYSGHFTGVRSIQRKMGFAIGEIEDTSGDDWEDRLIIHPGWLDSALQTLFAAYSCPGDNRLWTIHVPTAMRSISINPYFTSRGHKGKWNRYQYQTTAYETPTSPFCADIDIFADARYQQPFIQIEAVEVKPFASAVASDDVTLFTGLDYRVEAPNGAAAVTEEIWTPERILAVGTAERVGFFYVRRMHKGLTAAEKESALPHYKRFLTFAERIVATVGDGKHPNLPAEAVNDTPAYIRSLMTRCRDVIDIQLLEAAGENLIPEIKRDGSILEHILKDGLLDRFYEESHALEFNNVITGRVVAQIGHRYPGLRVLEVGAGTGGATSQILPALGNAYGSYTYTDVSASFFSRVQERFRKYVDRMTFATFDMERSPAEQGLEEGSYDVVVASNVLHATGRLNEAISGVRKLLRPGGYLVALEILSNYSLGIDAVMGALPGWWAGAEAESWRCDGPALNLDQWTELVRRHGFGGVDTHAPLSHPLQASSVFACQAIDPAVQTLRKPLGAPLPSVPQHLVIVGGIRPSVAKLAKQVTELLKARYATIIYLSNLEELNTRGLAHGSSVLSLTELDEQLFETRRAPTLDALKVLWRDGRNILWVARGARDASPYSGLMMGLCRVIRYEKPNVNLQVFDIDASIADTIEPSVVAEALVRLEIGKQITGDSSQNVLWSVEPEVQFNDGQIYVPRLYPDAVANERYNSIRRVIRRPVDRPQTKVSLTAVVGSNGNVAEIEALSPLIVRATSTEDEVTATTIPVEVQFSTLQTISIKGRFVRLVIGKYTASSANRNIAAIIGNGPIISSMNIPEHLTTPLSSPPTSAFVAHLANQLLAGSLVASAAPLGQGTLLVHEADELLRSAIIREATVSGLQVTFTTATKSSGTRSGSSDNTPVFVPGKLPLRLVEKVIPRDVTAFVDLSATDSTVGQLLRRSLPSRAKQFAASDFVRAPQAAISAEWAADQEDEIRQVLKATSLKVARLGSAARQSLDNSAYLVDLSQVSGLSFTTGSVKVVDWKTSGPVQAVVRPIDSGDIFRADGTYWLLGMSGDLSQSLCHWMVRHGARHVVLSSRNPKVHPRTFEALDHFGAEIRIEAVDITDRAMLQACHDKLQAEMPPIIGVANGALVLEDTLFDDLKWDSVQRTLPSKVEGSAYLDELFYTTPLDFFIMFTSVASVMGNSGQSTYVMANNFMVSLSKQRRDIRGVPGSAIAVSSLQGVGYITRLGFDQDRFDRLGYRNVSEQDVQALFAEAILAGRPGQTRATEVISGFQPFREGPTTHTQLKVDVKFQHLRIRDRDGGAGGQDISGGSGTKPRVRLGTVKSREEAVEVVQDAFIGRLRTILMMPVTETIDPSVSLVELGADSIMAVDVRAWFLKELDVDIPVLKILGAGETVSGLVEEALDKIPTEILDLANLGSNGGSAGDSDKAKAAPASAPAPKLVQPTEAVAPRASTVTASSTATPHGGSTDASLTPASSATSASASVVDFPREAAGQDSIKAEKTGAKSTSRQQAIIDSSTEHTEQMTFGQNRFWFLSHYVDEPTTFNIAYLAKLNGRIDADRLGKALKTVVQRHETLRTRYFWSDDQTRTPMQGILSQPLIELETATVVSEAQAKDELDAMRDHEWDFNNWVPLRMRLLSLKGSSDKHFLLIGTHHISLDGHSFSVLMLDIQRAYLAAGGAPSLPPLPQASQARGFGAKQRLAVSSGKLRPAIEHFRKSLSGSDLTRPIDLFSFTRTQGLRPPLDKYATHVAKGHLDAGTMTRLKQIARQHRVTGFHAVLGALQAFLFRMLPADTTQDVCIGLADANRLDAESMSSIGNFLNVLPVRFERGQRKTFRQAMEQARDHANGALKYSALPFDVLLEELDVPRSTSWAPIFQIFMDYRLVVKDQAEKKWINCKIDGEDWHTARSSYDVALEIFDSPDGAMVAMHVQQALYDADAAQLLLRSYLHFIKQLVSGGGEIETGQLDKWDPIDIKDALAKGSGPDMELEWPATVTSRIDQVIAHHGKDVALKDGYGRTLTYQAMNERVDSIAVALRAKLAGSRSAQEQVQPIVGVFQRPSADWMSSILAIWRCGGVYLPLDLRNGTPRLRSNVQSAQPDVILADSETVKFISEIDRTGRVAYIDISDLPRSTTSKYERSVSDGDDNAYIIFSSGSTGEPKGIVVQHASLQANLEGYHRSWNIEKYADVVLQQTALSFDASLVQIFAALTTGGCLVVAPAEARGDPAELTALMVQESVTMTQATPSEYDMWFRFAPETLHKCHTWRAAWYGGERAGARLLDGFRAACRALPQLQVFTSYGPTEATVSAMKGRADVRDPSLRVPVPGLLLPNYSAYIFDEENKPQPVGVPGEIIISGRGVGNNSYLYQPELTFETFRKDTVNLHHQGHRRMYRTGDLGRLDGQGRLTVEGRIAGDTQVKLRGFRIELGEIERVMMSEAAGALAAVVLTLREGSDLAGAEDEDDQAPFLAAHVVLDSSFRGDQNELLDRIRVRLPLRLPQYMCPAVIVVLDDMPLTAHHKVDRRAVQALPLPKGVSESQQQRQQQQEQNFATFNEVEKRLALIWQSLLPPSVSGTLSRQSDFFLIGANSLLLVKLQAKIKAEFHDAPRLNRLMSAPTLGSMAALVGDASSDYLVVWDREMTLDPALESIPTEALMKETKTDGLVVLLTGATGSLGGRILRRLVSDPRVASVWALVRDGKSLSTTVESDKLHILEVNLPWQAESIEDKLPSSIDVICHTAADRNSWDGFQAVRGVNFDAAKQLAALSLRTGAALHVISSGVVASYDTENSRGPLGRPSPDDGYLSSKWITERYLDRVARAHPSARIVSHRPTSPLHSEEPVAATTTTEGLLENWVADMASISHTLGARPDFSRTSGTISLARLDSVTDAVTDILLPSESSTGSGELQIFNHPGKARLSIETMAAQAATLAQGDRSYADLPAMSALHWVGEAKRAKLFDWFFTTQDLGMRDGEAAGGNQLATRR